MASWELAFDRNKRVLLVDMDLQGNASTLIARSTGVTEINTSIFEGFHNGSLKECIVEVTENLHMIPAQVSFKNFPKFLYTTVKEEIDQVSYLKKLLDPIREDYDYIFIDVPPTISDFSDNAMMAADYVLVILQAQELSLEGAETYIKYLQFMADNYDADIRVARVLPVKKKNDMDFGYSSSAKQDEPVTPTKTPTSKVVEKEVTKIEPALPRKKLNVGKKNRTKSLKVPTVIHGEINLLGSFMDEGKAYVILQELIESYVHNELTDRQQRQFEFMVKAFHEEK